MTKLTVEQLQERSQRWHAEFAEWWSVNAKRMILQFPAKGEIHVMNRCWKTFLAAKRFEEEK